MCDWFAACEQPSAGIVEHPILGDVEVCTDCARKLDLNLQSRDHGRNDGSLSPE